GSILGSFLMTAGREWLRFFDDPLVIGGFNVPLFRSGFRMVIFSLILMTVVLYYRKGLLGNREFSWNGIYAFLQRLSQRLKRQKVSKEVGKDD
ncbi:MAG: branched-chain amino acid ABC transporter permease, partial [Eubacteriales bacterium]|nr:branched-chain amino acid ABC transporter permease [Eubacteriales bacterium]